MPVTPTSNDAKAIDALRDRFAQSASFRSLVGAANEAAAKEFVFVFEEPVTDDFSQEFAIIHPVSSVNSMGAFKESMIFTATVFFPADEVTYPDPTDLYIDAMNKIGGIVDDILTASHGSSGLQVTTISREMAIRESIEEDTVGVRYFACSLTINAGFR